MTSCDNVTWPNAHQFCHFSQLRETSRLLMKESRFHRMARRILPVLQKDSSLPHETPACYNPDTLLLADVPCFGSTALNHRPSTVDHPPNHKLKRKTSTKPQAPKPQAQTAQSWTLDPNSATGISVFAFQAQLIHRLSWKVSKHLNIQMFGHLASNHLEASHGQIVSQSPMNSTSGRYHLNGS